MACSAQITHTMHPLWSRSALTVWRAVTPCCHAMLACSMRAQHASDTTALRACANYLTHLPKIKRPPRQQLLGHQVGDADDETTLQRGAPDVASMYMRVTFRRGVLVRWQQRRRPSSPANTLPLPANTLPRGHRIIASSGQTHSTLRENISQQHPMPMRDAWAVSTRDTPSITRHPCPRARRAWQAERHSDQS